MTYDADKLLKAIRRGLVDWRAAGEHLADAPERVLEAVWPEVRDALVELKATVLEYEHALQHAVDPHPVPGAPPQEACPDCQRLCQSALDGVNRADFREIAEEMFDGEAPADGE